jgi:hypothetical protein
MADVNAAIVMIDAFVEMSVTNFDLSIIQHVVTEDKTYDARVPNKQLTNAHFRELRFRIGKILPEAEELHHSVIIRPRPITTALLVQLDDLNIEKVDNVKSYAFLTIRTSPGNFQSWIAVSEAPRDKEGVADFARRFRRGVGADHRANGAGRLAGTRNFKPRHGPIFPVVEIFHTQCGHMVKYADLECAGLVAPKAPQQQIRRPPSVASLGQRAARRGWPDYNDALRGALPRADGSGPDRSKADAFWCKWAAERGYSVEEVAAELIEVSQKAREELARGNLDYAQEKAEWGAKVAR